VPPAYAARTLQVHRLIGSTQLWISTTSGVLVATHRRATPGSGVTISARAHRVALERVVLERFTTTKRCPSTTNRPPSDAALAAASALVAAHPPITTRTLDEYATLAGAVA
jgi:hypothetical protein